MLDQAKKFFAANVLILILSILVVIGVSFLEQAGNTGELIGVILMILNIIALALLLVLSIRSLLIGLQDERITFYGFHITNVVFSFLLLILFIFIFFV